MWYTDEYLEDVKLVAAAIPFISFASFSTSVMCFMSTMTYYESFSGTSLGFNGGLLFSVILVLPLIFLELSAA